MAGRLHKPINIIRNDPHFKLAVQLNCRSALRVALLLLPRTFFELELYTIIAGISYSGDPRMKLFTENPHKVHNIVNNQLHNFRDIYWPLIQQLPNTYFSKESATWNDPASELMIVQDMDPVQRGNMVCRLPNSFRDRLYFEYQKKYAISNLEFRKMISTSEGDEIISRNQSNEFDQRIAMDMENIQEEIGNAIKSTIWWPSTTQSLKGLITAGPVKSWKYLGEKMTKWKESKKSQGDG
jgi:translocator assembly and maintenance protein 41